MFDFRRGARFLRGCHNSVVFLSRESGGSRSRRYNFSPTTSGESYRVDLGWGANTNSPPRRRHERATGAHKGTETLGLYSFRALVAQFLPRRQDQHLVATLVWLSCSYWNHESGYHDRHSRHLYSGSPDASASAARFSSERSCLSRRLWRACLAFAFL